MMSSVRLRLRPSGWLRCLQVTFLALRTGALNKHIYNWWMRKEKSRLTSDEDIASAHKCSIHINLRDRGPLSLQLVNNFLWYGWTRILTRTPWYYSEAQRQPTHWMSSFSQVRPLEVQEFGPQHGRNRIEALQVFPSWTLRQAFLSLLHRVLSEHPAIDTGRQQDGCPETSRAWLYEADLTKRDLSRTSELVE